MSCGAAGPIHALVATVKVHMEMALGTQIHFQAG